MGAGKLMDKIKIKKMLSGFVKLRYGLTHAKGKIYIGNHCKIVNPRNIHFASGGGNLCQLSAYSMMVAHGNGHIYIGENVNIGMFSRLACINEIRIGNNVLTGSHIFISDYNHAYEDVTMPICKQGTTAAKDKVIIEDDSWIGTNVVICGNAHIGKHVVIGAGAFVNSDIPDYSVAVGNPARVIKKYNFDLKCWERVDK